jgi:hypothetical protein
MYSRRIKKPIRIVLAIMAGIASLSGCEKMELNPGLYNVKNYFPLEIGNYWVYEFHRINYITGDDVEIIDSMYISKDTLMLGYRFFMMEGTYRGGHIVKSFLRYDGKRVVNENGDVWFDARTNQKFNSVNVYIYNDTYPGDYETVRSDTLIPVPAGDFDNLLDFLITFGEEGQPSLFVHNYHARNVGMVMNFMAYPGLERGYLVRLRRFGNYLKDF